jgi:hypothetical protein
LATFGLWKKGNAPAHREKKKNFNFIGNFCAKLKDPEVNMKRNTKIITCG